MSRLNGLAGWLVAALSVCALFVTSALSGPTTPSQIDGCVYNATPPTLSDGQTAVFQCGSDGKLNVSASVSITNPTVGAAVPATAVYVAGNKGGLLTGLLLDGSGYLDVNCQTGCSGGTFNNNADNVATSATNGQSAAWLYGWDGAAWDRLYTGAGTEAQALRVTLPTDGTGVVKLGTGAATIGALSANQSVNVAQINGVTTLMGNGVTGTGSQRVTIASDNTAFTVNATATGNVASAGADSGNPVKIGGVFNTTPPAVTNGQRDDLQMTARGAVLMQIWDSANNVAAAMQADNADAVAASGTANRLAVMAKNQFYNGTTFDLAREIATGTNSTGVGIGAAGQMGQCDDTSPQLITENQFGNALIDCTNHTTVIGGLVTTAAPSYSTATSRGVSLTTAGGLREDLATVAGTTTDTNSGTKSAGTLRVVLATDQPALTNKLLVTPDSVALPANQSVNVSQMNAVTVLMGNGVTGTGSQRVTIASDNTAFSVNGTPTSSATVGGLTLSTLTLANSTNATNVKASAGQLYAISGFNMSSATPVWVSLYNNAGTPTCGTAIVYQFLIPGSTTGAGFVHEFTVPLQFATGIAYCATTGIAGTGSVAATTYVVNFGYK